MKRVAIFFTDGTEETEGIAVVDMLRRANIHVDTVSTTGNKVITGSHGIPITMDMLIDDMSENHANYDAVVIPGGMPGSNILRDDDRVISFVKKMNESGKICSAICAGPIVLAKADVIDGKAVTSYPGFSEPLEAAGAIYKENIAVVDGNIITARGPALVFSFSLKLIEALVGVEVREKLEKAILWDQLKAEI